MRIIGGKHKGKTLSSFDLNNIRPTSDNVKEAIFNKLQFDIPNCSFLDLFGGTGSVGLEAYSRGAKSVVIADNNKNSIKLITKNAVSINASVEILFGNYETVLKQLKNAGKKFDIIFIDPPYDTEFGVNAIHKVVELGLLNNDGVIVFEHNKTKNFLVANELVIIDKKTYGSKSVTYLQVGDNND